MSERRWRLPLIGLAILPAALVLAALLWVITVARVQEAEVQFTHQASAMVEQLATSLDYPLMADQPALASHAVDSLLSQPGMLQVRIRDARGRVWLTRTHQDGTNPPAYRQGRWITTPVRLQDAGGDDFFEKTPVMRPPLGSLEVEVDHGMVRESEGHLLMEAVQIGFAMLMAIGIACWLLSDHMARRIARWRQPADGLSAVDHHWGKLSHDLRTPLSGLAGMLELLSTTPLDAEQAGYLRHAREAADALRDSLDGRTRLFRADLASVQAPPQDSHRVLVVEDDIVSAHVLRGQLQDLGVEAHVVTCGEDALALAGAHWDLVLLDGELPDMTADVCWQRWREQVSWTRDALPFAACITAHDDGPARRQFAEAGLETILLKPVSRESLKALLDRQHQPLQETASADRSGHR